jgi:hypothetical protein
MEVFATFYQTLYTSTKECVAGFHGQEPAHAIPKVMTKEVQEEIAKLSS